MSVTTVNTEFLKNVGATKILYRSYMKMPDNQVFYNYILNEKTLSGVYSSTILQIFDNISKNSFTLSGASNMYAASSGQYLYFLNSNKNILNSKFSCSSFSGLGNGTKIINIQTLELVVTANEDVTLDKIVFVYYTGTSNLYDSSFAYVANGTGTCIEIFNIDQIALVIASGEMKKFVFNINIV